MALSCRSINQHVFDFYDDGGALLLELFGARETVPTAIRKTAALEDPSLLQDRDFGLVAYDGWGQKARKFPMHDPQHATISTLYLTQQADDLPDQVLKTAAARLGCRLREFGIDSQLPTMEHMPPLDLSKVVPKFEVAEEMSKEASAEGAEPEPFPPEAAPHLLRLLNVKKTMVRNPAAYDEAATFLHTKTAAADVIDLLDKADVFAGLTRPSFSPNNEQLVKAAMEEAQGPAKEKAKRTQQMMDHVLKHRKELSELVGEQVFQDMLENPAAVLKALPEGVRSRVARILREG